MQEEDIVEREHFMFTLQWLMGLLDRDPATLHYGLVHICFHNQEALGNTYGAKDGMKMLCQLLHELRAAFRKTDLVTRIGTDFWILVPYTSAESVTEKVKHFVEVASENGFDIVDRDIAVFDLPNPELVGNHSLHTPDALLEHLKATQKIAAHWERKPLA